MIRTILFVALGLLALYYLVVWWLVGRARGSVLPPPSAEQLGIGFVTNFFDTLGIGSFAPTTSIFKFRRLVDDQVIPGTLNVGHTLPTIAQAYIYTSLIAVDMKTLALMILAAVAGSWLGAGIVAGWPRRKVQMGMGLALLAAAVLLTMKVLKLVPEGAGTLSLEGPRLLIGTAGNFMLGALMTLGIGLYAPCLVLVGLLGMVESTAFPIMMSSCAFLMPVASARFMQARRFDARASVGLGLGGLPAVLIAAYVVKTLSLDHVRVLVVVVVVYTAVMMLRSAAQERAAAESQGKR